MRFLGLCKGIRLREALCEGNSIFLEYTFSSIDPLTVESRSPKAACGVGEEKPKRELKVGTAVEAMWQVTDRAGELTSSLG